MSKSGAVSVTGAGAGAGYDRYDRQFRPNLPKNQPIRPYTLSFRNFWHERTGLVQNFGNKFGQKGKTWSEVEMILVLTVSYLV